MFAYPALFEASDGGGFVVSFRDIPEALTQGDSLEDAKAEAVAALETAMEFYLEDERAVPVPSKPQKGEVIVALPVETAAKVALLNAMVQKRMRPVDLARAMNVRPQEVTRIMDAQHATRMSTMEKALKAVGLRVELMVVAA